MSLSLSSILLASRYFHLSSLLYSCCQHFSSFRLFRCISFSMLDASRACQHIVSGGQSSLCIPTSKVDQFSTTYRQQFIASQTKHENDGKRQFINVDMLAKPKRSFFPLNSHPMLNALCMFLFYSLDFLAFNFSLRNLSSPSHLVRTITPSTASHSFSRVRAARRSMAFIRTDLVHLNKSNNVGGHFGYRSINITLLCMSMDTSRMYDVDVGTAQGAQQRRQPSKKLSFTMDQYNFRLDD